MALPLQPSTPPSSPTRRRRRRSLAVVAAVSAILVTGVVADGRTPATAQITPDELGAAGELHTVTPTRILDTRTGIGAPIEPRAVQPDGRAFEIDVLGRAGVPARGAEVLAVLANITVTNADVTGYLTVAPCCDAVVTASNVNFAPGRTVANMSVLQPGADGRVRITLFGPVAGTAHVLVDVFAWISSSDHATRGARLVPVAPGRILDTRRTDDMGPRTWRRVNVRGADPLDSDVVDIVPASTAVTAVLVNVTAINDLSDSLATFVSLVPERPSGPPETSNLNLIPGQVRANLAVVPLGADGRIHVYNSQGTMNVAIDVMGYFLAGRPVETRSGRIQPTDLPFRVFDTRLPEFGAARLGANQAEIWDFGAVVESTTVGGFPIGEVSAVFGNLTATEFTPQGSGPQSTYLTLYPGYPTPALPTASTVNLVPDEDVANMALIPLAPDDTLRVYNANGQVHYLYDLSAFVLGD